MVVLLGKLIYFVFGDALLRDDILRRKHQRLPFCFGFQSNLNLLSLIKVVLMLHLFFLVLQGYCRLLLLILIECAAFHDHFAGRSVLVDFILTSRRLTTILTDGLFILLLNLCLLGCDLLRLLLLLHVLVVVIHTPVDFELIIIHRLCYAISHIIYLRHHSKWQAQLVQLIIRRVIIPRQNRQAILRLKLIAVRRII